MTSNHIEWFEKLDADTKDNSIKMLYELCIRTKDESNKKFEELINQKHSSIIIQKDSVITQKDTEITKLKISNEIFKEIQQNYSTDVKEHIKNIELKVSEGLSITRLELGKSISDVSIKLTPSVKGKVGENNIDHILGNIPGGKLTNVSITKGGGDFKFVINGIKIMIESKAIGTLSLKETEAFKKTATEFHESDKIDFAVMAHHCDVKFKGTALSIEKVETKRGRLILIYVANLFNHPERLLYTINTGLFLFENQPIDGLNIVKFLESIDDYIKIIESLEHSSKEKEKNIISLRLSVNEDNISLKKLKEKLVESTRNTDTGRNLSIKEKVIKLYISLEKQGKVSVELIKKECSDNGIANNIFNKEIGGIKQLKQMVLDSRKVVFTCNEEEEEEEEEEESKIILFDKPGPETKFNSYLVNKNGDEIRVASFNNSILQENFEKSPNYINANEGIDWIFKD